MGTKISGTALRDRLLNRFQSEPAPADITEILALKSNRDLLSFVARRKPRSIGELSDLAGRAQPNVSRSLNSLVWAGLVKLEADGRRSIPTLTQVGMQKAQELDLAEPFAEFPEDAALDSTSGARFSLLFDTDIPNNIDEAKGSLAMKLRFKACDEAQDLYLHEDLSNVSLRLTENWWRMCYRRGAPFRFGDFSLGKVGSETRLSCAFQSSGSEIEITSRYISGMGPRPDRNSSSVASFERVLLQELIRPVAERLAHNLSYDRPLQSYLSRLEEAREDISETRYCKTIGALGLSPYNVPRSIADCVRSIIATMPDDDARLEFASAVLSEDLVEAKTWVNDELERRRKSNRMAGLPELKRRCHELVHEPGLKRWKLGIHYARAVRETLRWSIDKPVGGIVGINRAVGSDEVLSLSRNAPGSLRAFRGWNDNAPEIILEDEGPIASAFLFSRAIGDYLAFGGEKACVADLYTDRQATNRAFAAELIAPSEGVVGMIEDGVPAHRVATHYGASIETIHRQYDNNVEIYLGA